jgi:hypothetical protein
MGASTSESRTRFEPDPDWANEAADMAVEELVLTMLLAPQQAAIARGLVSRQLYRLLCDGVRPLGNFPGRAERAAAADDSGWLDWEGGKQPLDDRLQVEVRFRGGSTHEAAADQWDWSHIGASSDIIAFRPMLDRPPR